MSEITEEEKRSVVSCCSLVGGAPDRCEEIVNSYIRSDSSFDYLFYLERLRTAAKGTPTTLVKAIKGIKTEVSRREIERYGFVVDQLPIVAVAGQQLDELEGADEEE